MIRTRPLIYACVLTLAGACGSSPSSPSSGDVTITIGANGLSPSEVQVKVGGKVTFVNSDARPHAMSSDPIQTHTDCPAINDVGFLNPGQSRATSALNTVRTCGFHDHTNETDPTWKGRITIVQ
jgi:plastocyanin